MVDCSENALQYCAAKAGEEGLEIRRLVLASMMLMDCEGLDGTVREIVRVLKPGGRLFASVCHPRFHRSGGIGRQRITGWKKGRRIELLPAGRMRSALVRGTVPVIWRRRTLQDYVKTFMKGGLAITDLHEPVPTEEQTAVGVDIAWM